MNLAALKKHLQLFDERGLDPNTVNTLRLLIYAVGGGIVWSNITQGIAMTGYMKELGASDFLYGVVIALPSIANAFQFLASYWMERALNRKWMFLFFGLMQRVIWIPFALVPFFIPATKLELRLFAAVSMAFVSAAAAPFMNVSFFSILSDVVPMRIRGRYLATRSRVSTCLGLLAGLAVGWVLDALPGYSGYMIVFLLAGVMGTLDISLFFLMKLPDLRQAEKQTGLWRMLKTVLTDREYMKIILCLTAWLFSVQLCAPYFNVFMHSDFMGMSNSEIIICGQVANNILVVLVVTRWGRAIDRYGNKPVLIVAALLAGSMPFSWTIMGANMLVMVFLTNAWSGATYCAVDLTMTNLFMGQSREENRSMYFAVYFLFSQLAGIALGSATGGWLLDNVLWHVEDASILLAGVPFTRYNALFLLSALLRMVVVFALLPLIREPGCATVPNMLKQVFSETRVAASRRLGGIKRMRMRGQYRKNDKTKGDSHGA